MLFAWIGIGSVLVICGALLFGRHKTASVRPQATKTGQNAAQAVKLRPLTREERDSLAGFADSIGRRENTLAGLPAKDPRRPQIVSEIARCKGLINKGLKGVDPDTIPETVLPYVQL